MKNHYDTLGLSRRQFDASLTVQDVKQAYRHTLLQHHPDKINDNNTTSQNTVDAITLAYKTLSEPALKTEYDRELRLSQSRSEEGNKTSFTGLDTVDLDDLQYDEVKNEWWRSCRCGQDRGFVVTEDELEKDSHLGELITGCRGCSLWLKVLFGVEDDDENDSDSAASATKVAKT